MFHPPRSRRSTTSVSLVRALWAAWAGACVVGVSAEAAAQEVGQYEDRGSRERKETEDVSRRFEPYFSSGPYTTIQRVKGNVATTFGPSAEPQNVLTNLGWFFEVGVVSPSVDGIPGRPRFNLSAAVMIPTNESSVLQSTLVKAETEMGLLAESAKMQVEYQTSYRAGLGAEFTVDFLGVDLHLTPGAQYLYLGSRYVAETSSTFVPSAFGNPNIEYSSAAKNALVQHLVGPSLKIGTEDIEMGPFVVDFFVEGSLLFDVAGTRQQSRAVAADGEVSTFTWEAETTAGLFNAGFRVRLP